MKTAPIRSPLMSKTFARNAIGHRTESQFTRVLSLIEDANTTLSGLELLHSTANPDLTKTARALQYKKRYDQTTERIKREATTIYGELADFRDKRIYAAEVKAGLHNDYSQADLQEIRAAMKGMSDQVRNKFVADAAQNGDAIVLQAVRTAPHSVVIGSISTPVDELIKILLDKHDPELAQTLEDVEIASQSVENVATGFLKSAGALRDPVLEEQGQQQQAAILQAEQVLNA